MKSCVAGGAVGGANRETMFQRLTGMSRASSALEFRRRPPRADSSPGAHHGKMIGKATTVSEALPDIMDGSTEKSPIRWHSAAGARVEIRETRT